MKKTLLVTLALLVSLFVASLADAQTTDPTNWPVCKLGAAPIAPGPAPTEATVFRTTGGPVIMSEAGPQGTVKLIRCRLAPGVEVYRGADGDLRDLPSNQPFWPVGWDAFASPTPLADAIRGLDGKDGIDGKNGIDGKDGRDGKDASPPVVHHSHKKWPWIVVGIVVVGTGTAIAVSRFKNVAIATVVVNK